MGRVPSSQHWYNLFFINLLQMKSVIKIQFPVSSSSSVNSSVTLQELDFIEANALRYIGGYLLRSLSKKIMKSANPMKEELLLCLADLLEG